MLSYDQVTFRKSSFCESGGCVEVATMGSSVLLRDSKDPQSPVLTFPKDQWTAFLEGVRENEFEAPIG